MNPKAQTGIQTAKSTPIAELRAQGQSIWLDFIRRSLFTTGELKRLIEHRGVTGMTSNPTIFDKAIAGSSDYDDTLAGLLRKNPNASASELFDALAIEDIRMAAESLQPSWERSGGVDGYVSLEVVPGMARDTRGTIEEARRLWRAVARPNLLIKVPATAEGIPAVEALIGEGINVNITLMFSMAHYEAVAQAYIRGLQKCARPEQMASVASFFVSRVDTLVDKKLEALGTPEAKNLRGKIGIANSRQVYQRFLEIFHGEPFAALRKRGARAQRVLWASTSTKNPAYPDTLYVDELIGADTINTMPPETLEAFADHGHVRGATVLEAPDRAAEELAALAKAGVSLAAVTEQLQVEGVASFAKSFDELMRTLDNKRAKMAAGSLDGQGIRAGAVESAANARLAAWDEANFGRRYWDKDFTLWSEKPVPEISDRMGWMHLPETMKQPAAGLTEFREQIRKEGFTHAVLMGMGGSSLAPEVFQKTFGAALGCPELIVLDSTHPAAVRGVEKRIDAKRTLFIVSSKSGTTQEMLSFFRYFWSQIEGAQRGRQFVAITDPGTPLEQLGKERGFRQVFRATPDVGGRYSALTDFGLVPAAVIGVDLGALLGRAAKMSEACSAGVPAAKNPGLELGALLGEAAVAGRDKLTFSAGNAMAALPVWLEQLVAESTGKSNRGILPVAGEPLAEPGEYGKDRVFVDLRTGQEPFPEKELAALEAAGHPVVRIRLNDTLDIAQEFFRWEMAVPAAGAVIGIQPFNQPDVQLAKDLARNAMKAGGPMPIPPEAVPVPASDAAELQQSFAAWLGTRQAGNYVALQAYLEPRADTSAALERIRMALRRKTRLATTAGYGPRFLHSTGQFHKGGPNTGLFLQLVDDTAPDLPVPETDYSFGALIRAQALGDWQALTQRGRRVLRVQLGGDVAAGLKQLEVLASG